jgi:hypothetical protein
MQGRTVVQEVSDPTEEARQNLPNVIGQAIVLCSVSEESHGGGLKLKQGGRLGAVFIRFGRGWEAHEAKSQRHRR